MHPGLDRVHRPQPHRLERHVIQLAAVVFAHASLSRNPRSKSAYLRSCWVCGPCGWVLAGSAPTDRELLATWRSKVDVGLAFADLRRTDRHAGDVIPDPPL